MFTEFKYWKLFNPLCICKVDISLLHWKILLCYFRRCKIIGKLRENNYNYTLSYYYYSCILLYIGFFKALNQEFIMTNTRVAITIMPLPYILTETVSYIILSSNYVFCRAIS